MISKNSHLNKNFSFPFLLKPVGKDYLWGGNKLNTEFGKGIDMKPLAETWECSTHPDGISQIASGEYKGLTLKELIQIHPEILGTRHKGKNDLPIMAKYIDAKEDLSVQVHPSDEYAKINEHGQQGKSEMWYVVDASIESEIVYGFNRNVDRESIEDSLKRGFLEIYLQRVPIKKNEIYFIDSGTIHAIGKGSLIIEIQENSNLTYRLYDYDRVDKKGNKRELHIKKALDVLDYKSKVNIHQPMRILKYEQGCAHETLCICNYFEVNRMLVNTEVLRETLSFKSDKLSFRILMCFDGCGSIRYEENNEIKIIDFFKGDTIFFPANSVECKIHGKAKFLDVRC